MAESAEAHPFELLCAEAASKRWCWKLVCTTCGALDLRAALWGLASRLSPPKGTRLLGAWPHRIQRELIAQVEAAPLERIVRSAPFPDGLGYLGMVLSIAAEAESVERRLTTAWCPQLAALADTESDIFAGSTASWPARDGVLRPWDLERVESAMRSLV